MSGILEPGDMLRSEREYAEYYQVSRMTVRQAISTVRIQRFEESYGMDNYMYLTNE